MVECHDVVAACLSALQKNKQFANNIEKLTIFPQTQVWLPIGQHSEHCALIGWPAGLLQWTLSLEESKKPLELT